MFHEILLRLLIKIQTLIAATKYKRNIKITTQKIIKQQIQEETLMDKLKEDLKMETIVVVSSPVSLTKCTNPPPDFCCFYAFDYNALKEIFV